MVTDMQFQSNYGYLRIKEYSPKNEKKSNNQTANEFQKQFIGTVLKDDKEQKRKNIRAIQILNTAYTPQVKNYVADITENINNLKYNVQQLKRKSDDVNSLRQICEEDIEIFEDSINNIIKYFNDINDFIAKESVNSDTSNMSILSNGIEKVLRENSEIIKNIGFGLKQSKLVRKKYLDFNNFKQNTQSVSEIMDNINDHINEFLLRPMSENIKFNSYKFYVNYNISNVYNNTFKLFESGVTIDYAI